MWRLHLVKAREPPPVEVQRRVFYSVQAEHDVFQKLSGKTDIVLVHVVSETLRPRVDPVGKQLRAVVTAAEATWRKPAVGARHGARRQVRPRYAALLTIPARVNEIPHIGPLVVQPIVAPPVSDERELHD